MIGDLRMLVGKQLRVCGTFGFCGMFGMSGASAQAQAKRQTIRELQKLYKVVNGIKR
jgi:hypothetical protein